MCTNIVKSVFQYQLKNEKLYERMCKKKSFRKLNMNWYSEKILYLDFKF